MQHSCGRNKEVGWKDGQKYISLAISSDPQAGTAHMPSGFSADKIQKISLFLTPDMSIWRRPASFTILAVCKDTDWPGLQIGNTHHSWKCIFCHWDSRKLRETGTQEEGRSRHSKTAFSLLLKPMMQIFMHETERNSWVILLPCLKTHPHLKGELTTVPKFENVLMSEFCSIYMPSAKSSQLPAYHKSLLSLPSSSPLKPLQFSVQNTNAQVGYSVYESSACERRWMHSPGDPHPLQYSKGKKDTSWIAALSASSLRLSSLTEIEETLTEVKGSFILYSQVVVLTTKIAI